MSTLRITTLEKLHEYLRVAMQLEHATIPPYLTALYSIHPQTNSDATHVLRVIVVEEMLHLTLAANILNAVGGKPDLTAPGFVPKYPAFLPDGETDFKVDLQPFSIAAVQTFLKIERPRKAPSENVRVVRRHRGGAATLCAMPDASDMAYYSIGEFYEEIKRGLRYLHETLDDKLFTGDPRRQVTSEYYYSGGGKLFPVTDLKSALAAADLVIEQGEGITETSKDVRAGLYSKENELAHDYRFQQLVLGQYYQAGDTPGAPTGPPVQVDWNAVYPIKLNASLSDYPDGSELRAAAVAFNKAYAGFLALLTSAYNGKPQLLLEAVPMMFELRNRITQLMHNPIPGMDGVNAAPTFEVEGVAAGVAPCGTMIERFLAFSAEVTAFTEFELRGTGLAAAYLAAVEKVIGRDLLGQLLDAYERVPRGTDGERAPLLRRNIFGDEKFGPIARNIIKLWYIGGWYELPHEWTDAFGAIEENVRFMVSAAAYTEGLLWPAIGANPPGAKGPGYGSWAGPPQIPQFGNNPGHPIHLDPAPPEEQQPMSPATRTLDPQKVPLGITPTLWWNDDFPSIDIGITFGQCVSEMALAGFQGCSVGHKYPTDPAVLKAALDQRGLRVSEPWVSTYFTIKEMKKRTLDTFHQQMDFIKRMGATDMVMAEFGQAVNPLPAVALWPNRPRFNDRQWNDLCKGLEHLGEIANANGLRLCYHPHLGTGVMIKEDIDRLMDNTSPDLVHLLLDTGHLAGAFVDPLEVTKQYGRRIKHIHLKDVRADVVDRLREENLSFYDAIEAGVFTVPGDGDIDFVPIFAALADAGFEGWLVVEAEQDPAKANPLQYAKMARSYLRKKLGW